MNIQKTESALGIGRRLRILPQPSCPPGAEFTCKCSGCSQSSTNYMTMRDKHNQLRDNSKFLRSIEPLSNCFPEAYLMSSNQRISIKGDVLNERESFLFTRRCPDLIHQSLWMCSPLGSPRNANRIHLYNQRIVPSLIRLVDDLTGKEAGWETNIGDKKNVNKHIN